MPAPHATAHPVGEDRIAAVRRFNRFHTRAVGALQPRLLASAYPLPQLRLLYEIAHAPTTAAQLGRALALDAGYLSRLIAGLEADGLVARAPSPGHAKRLTLSLTAAGRKLFKRLDAESSKEVVERLQRLPEHEQAQLVDAMAQVQRLLGHDAPAGASFTMRAAVGAASMLRDLRPGDLGAIVRGQALLYTREYGWDWTFEAFVADIAARFVLNFEPGAERCWIAERDGQVVGSVFVVREDAETAKLRMLYVDPAARGGGLGRRLVDESLAFARNAGYRRMLLWTNDVLVSARRIYEAAGFALLETQRHRSFGKELVGQVWGRDL